LPLAKRRIDQLEQQIELLQEHAETLETEIGGFNDEKKLIYETCNEDRIGVEKELESCKTRNNALVRNLGKLEEMINDLEDIKTRESRAGKKSGGAASFSTAPITKSIRQMAELEEKNRHLQDRLKRTNGELKGSHKEVERLPLSFN
jgi:chromosome segregation ATPase